MEGMAMTVLNHRWGNELNWEKVFMAQSSLCFIVHVAVC